MKAANHHCNLRINMMWVSDNIYGKKGENPDLKSDKWFTSRESHRQLSVTELSITGSPRRIPFVRTPGHLLERNRVSSIWMLTNLTDDRSFGTFPEWWSMRDKRVKIEIIHMSIKSTNDILDLFQEGHSSFFPNKRNRIARNRD